MALHLNRFDVGQTVKYLISDQEFRGSVMYSSAVEVRVRNKNGMIVTLPIDESFEVVSEECLVDISDVPGESSNVTVVRKVREGTKTQRAVAIYQEMSNKPRKDVIQVFMTELQMTLAGASTYYANAKKASSSQNFKNRQVDQIEQIEQFEQEQEE